MTALEKIKEIEKAIKAEGRGLSRDYFVLNNAHVLFKAFNVMREIAIEFDDLNGSNPKAVDRYFEEKMK